MGHWHSLRLDFLVTNVNHDCRFLRSFEIMGGGSSGRQNLGEV